MLITKRVDRLERIVKFMVRAGRKLRSDLRQHDETVGIAITGQIMIEDKIDRIDSETRDELEALTESIKKTDRRVSELFEIVHRKSK